MRLIKKLNETEKQIADLVRQRDNMLCKLRKQCKHPRLVELDTRIPSNPWLKANPPRRICIKCGAEERGWGSGYHILTLKEGRVIAEVITDYDYFDSFRKRGPLYPVGQSHPNFGEGSQTYKQLTEILPHNMWSCNF